VKTFTFSIPEGEGDNSAWIPAFAGMTSRHNSLIRFLVFSCGFDF
jgi:hypothetical protein